MTREDEMKEAATVAADEAENATEKLRCLLLARGYNGIMQFGRLFRLADDDGSRSLNLEELTEALNSFGLQLSEDEIAEIFGDMDEDGTGSINYDEFLDKLRPEMTEDRTAIVLEAFAKLDESGDGVVTLEDVKGNYDASNHPKVIEGEMSEDDVLTKFLCRFEGSTKHDGKVTKEEFLDYYSGVSKSIDEDEYFVAMMKSAWKL